MLNKQRRSKLRGISLVEFIDLIEANFEKFDPQRLKTITKIRKVYPKSQISLTIGCDSNTNKN
mgnify:CR=1 FL=1